MLLSLIRDSLTRPPFRPAEPELLASWSGHVATPFPGRAPLVVHARNNAGWRRLWRLAGIAAPMPLEVGEQAGIAVFVSGSAAPALRLSAVRPEAGRFVLEIEDLVAPLASACRPDEPSCHGAYAVFLFTRPDRPFAVRLRAPGQA